ncbi:MAG: hypothetical protein JO364_06305 [Pseudonocardiales bacterium]|nr:hypothetical protein [Pseudonocardiales bacterium]MBV9029914.1 hypothetical protein [Pseudonocardiales bacterium]
MTTLGRTAPCAPTAAVPRCVVNDAGRKLIELLSVTVALGAYRSVLAEVLVLAAEAPGLSDERLRVRLVGLDDRVARQLGGKTR